VDVCFVEYGIVKWSRIQRLVDGWFVLVFGFAVGSLVVFCWQSRPRERRLSEYGIVGSDGGVQLMT